MAKKEKILVFMSLFLLMGLFIYIIFSKHGYLDLIHLKQEQSRLIQKNDQLARENHAISIEIDRLENDLSYIESIARQELGMIKKDEIILKPKRERDRKK
jgi:cell division protein FtsB